MNIETSISNLWPQIKIATQKDMVQSSCSRRKPHLEDEESDLFKEAQEFIKNKLNNIDLDPIKNKLTNIDIDRSLVQNLSGIAYACGIASKEQCVQQQRQAEEEGYNFIDEGIKVDWKMDPVKSMSDWILVVHDGSKKQLYHIHQFVVTTGDRKSGLLKKYINKSTIRSNDVGLHLQRYAPSKL